MRSEKAKEKAASLELDQMESELTRLRHNSRFRKLLKSTVYTLIVVAAVAVLVAVLFMPVIRIYGSSMTPTLYEGEIVVSLKGAKVSTGDVVAVYYGSKLLIKRCIATAGQWVDIDPDGNVYVYSDVPGEPLDEPYVTEKAYGDLTDIVLPYQVPDNHIFVMGDHRATSADSRSRDIGGIDEENIVGKIVFRIWPLKDIGRVG